MKITKTKSSKTKIIHITFLLIALTIGVFFRLYKIADIPYGTNHDGAWSGIWAIELSQKPLPVQIYHEDGWLGEGMTRYILAIFIKLLGPTALSLRLGMTVFTILALPMMYLLIYQLTKKRLLAFFTTILLSTSGWDIIFAKSGWRTPSVPVFVMATTYTLLKAFETGKRIYFIAAGILLAGTLNTYNAAQFMPVTIIALIILWLIQSKKYTRKTLFNLSLLCIFFTLSIYPLANYAVNNKENYLGRNKSLFLGNRIKEEQSLAPLYENVQKIIKMYTIKAGGDDFFVSEPLLDFPTNYLFIIGLFIALTKINLKQNSTMVILFLTSLAPSLAGTPNGSHAIGSVPAVYYFAGYGLISLYTVLKKLQYSHNLRLDKAIITLILILAIKTTFDLYFGPQRRVPWGFYPETTIVGNYMKPRIPDTDFYLTDNFPRDALTFLTYQGGDPWTKYYTWFEDKNSFLEVKINSTKNTSFIMFDTSDNEEIVQVLQNNYPEGSVSKLTYKDDTINSVEQKIVIFRIPKQENYAAPNTPTIY